jgi:hypothetical protein
MVGKSIALHTDQGLMRGILELAASGTAGRNQLELNTPVLCWEQFEDGRHLWHFAKMLEAVANLLVEEPRMQYRPVRNVVELELNTGFDDRRSTQV